MNTSSKFLWIAPFACFITGYLGISFLHTNKTFKAPCLVGQTVNQAAQITSNANLNIRIIGQRQDPELPEGIILHQTPAANTPIKENQALYITISQKPEPTKVPQFYNTSIEQALAQHQNSIFTLMPHYFASDMPHGTIIGQYPNPGIARADKKITLYVADSYAKPVIMPDLKNRSVDEITSFLSLHGIQPQIIHVNNYQDQVNHECHGCMVIDQRPLPGAVITLSATKPITIQLQVR